MLGLGAWRRWLRSDRRRLGRWGERRARAFLRRRGWQILARNWRCPAGEVDIVAIEPGGTVVFVEVKTQRNEAWAPTQQDVHWRKRQHVSRTAQWFVRHYRLHDRPLRLDVIAIVLPEKGRIEIRHYPRAFRLVNG